MKHQTLTRFILYQTLIMTHTLFLILSYSQLLNQLSEFYALVIHRTLIVVQFTIIILVILISTYYKLNDKFLLGMSIATAINSIFTLDDFLSGFYGASLDSSSGIVPRMRTSAHMMAYNDLGHIVILDYHAEYFLEFLTVHVLSQILNVNYIIVYIFIIKFMVILLWTTLFILIYRRTYENIRPYSFADSVAILIVASSILMGSVTSYNSEQESLGSLLSILLLLLLLQKRTLNTKIPLFLILFGVLFTSFLEISVLALMFLIAICIKFVSIRKFKETTYIVLLVLLLSRIFQITNLVYVDRYLNSLFNIIYSFIRAVTERVIETEQIFPRIGTPNPVDKVYSSFTVYSYLSVLILLAFLSITCIYKLSRQKNALHVSILVTYLFLFSLTVITYPLSKAGFNIPSDMSSMRVTFLFLLPLVSMLVAKRFSELANLLHKKRVKSVFMVIVIVILILAPQYIHLGDVKSVYDMIRVKENVDKDIIFSNNLYHFVTTYIMKGSKIFSSHDYIIDLYYSLPINYKLKTGLVGYQINETQLYDISFNNGVYKVLIIEPGLVLSR